MSLGKWSRGGGIAEVLCPLPVPDLRHILQIFADIVVVALQFLVEEVDGFLGLQTEARDVLQCIERKMEAAHFIENHHVEWCRGRSAVHIAVYMEAAFIGASVNQGMNEPAIVVEGEDHRRFFGEERVERHFVHPVRMLVGEHQSHQVDNVDNAHLDARDMFLQQPRGRAGLDRGHIAGTGQYDIRLPAFVVGCELPCGCAASSNAQEPRPCSATGAAAACRR